MKTKNIFLASPRGFCAGVKRAILIVEKAIEKFGTPIYLNHEIVHNQFVVDNFKKKGVIFTDDISQIPEKSIYIFSAHGVSPKFRKKAEKKNLKIIDATCPLVTKVHWEAEKFSKEKKSIFYIGQKNHQEFLGIQDIGSLNLIEKIEDVEKINANNFKNEKVVCLTQTTLSVKDTEKILNALKNKIPQIQIPVDICYATTNRQNAVKNLCQKSDFVIVIGSQNSSNSNKLVTVARENNGKAQLFENAQVIPETIFEYENIGITSGASVPEILIEEVIKLFQEKNKNIKIETIKTFQETVEFSLPKEIR